MRQLNTTQLGNWAKELAKQLPSLSIANQKKLLQQTKAKLRAGIRFQWVGSDSSFYEVLESGLFELLTLWKQNQNPNCILLSDVAAELHHIITETQGLADEAGTDPNYISVSLVGRRGNIQAPLNHLKKETQRVPCASWVNSLEPDFSELMYYALLRRFI